MIWLSKLNPWLGFCQYLTNRMKTEMENIIKLGKLTTVSISRSPDLGEWDERWTWFSWLGTHYTGERLREVFWSLFGNPLLAILGILVLYCILVCFYTPANSIYDRRWHTKTKPPKKMMLSFKIQLSPKFWTPLVFQT